MTLSPGHTFLIFWIQHLSWKNIFLIDLITFSPIVGPPPPYQIDSFWSEEDDDDSLQELLNQQRDDHEDVLSPDLYCESGDADFDDFLTFISIFGEESPKVEEGKTNGTAKTFIPIVEERKRANKLSSISAPMTVRDIPFIMTKLPTSVQARFLDKFAESAGMHFTEMIAQKNDSVTGNSSTVESTSQRERTLSQQKVLYERIQAMGSPGKPLKTDI